MSPNLRSVAAQCYRLGGRSNGCRQTRNFTSMPEKEKVRENVVAALKRNSAFPWVLIGFWGFSSWEVRDLLRYAKVTKEEFELRKQLHEELVAKAEREINERFA